MANKQILFELDESAHEALDALKQRLGVSDIPTVVRAALGGYSALLELLGDNPDLSLCVVNQAKGEFQELELRCEGLPVFPPKNAKVIELFPKEESDKEIEEFLNNGESSSEERAAYFGDPDPEADDDPDVTQEMIDDALDAAKENGYDYTNHREYEDLAIDLANCYAGLEKATVRQLVPLIKDWQLRRA